MYVTAMNAIASCRTRLRPVVKLSSRLGPAVQSQDSEVPENSREIS